MKHSLTRLALILAISQLSCKHNPPVPSGAEDDKRSISDCLEYVEDRLGHKGIFEVRGPLVTLYPSARLKDRKSGGVQVPVEAFEGFQKLYSPSAMDRANETLLDDFARHIHVTRILDEAAVSIKAAQVDQAFVQIRSRFPDDLSFERFLEAVGADESALKAAVCRDLRIEAYLERYFEDDEIKALQANVKALYARQDAGTTGRNVDTDEADIHRQVYRSLLFHLYSTRLQATYEVHKMNLQWLSERQPDDFMGVDMIRGVASRERLEWALNDYGKVGLETLPLIEDATALIETSSTDYTSATVLAPDALVLENEWGLFRYLAVQPSVSGLLQLKSREIGAWSRPLGTIAYRDLHYRTEVSTASPVQDSALNTRIFACGKECPPGEEARRPVEVKIFDKAGFDEWRTTLPPASVGRSEYLAQCATCHGAKPTLHTLDAPSLVREVLEGHQSLSLQGVEALRRTNYPLSDVDEMDVQVWRAHTEIMQRLMTDEALHSLLSYLIPTQEVSESDVLAMRCSLGLVAPQLRIPLSSIGSFLKDFDSCAPQVRETLQRGGAKALETQRELGKSLYMEQCASCHGKSGAGDGPAGPILLATNFLDPDAWNHGSSPLEVLTVLYTGIENKAMPSYAHLDSEALLALAYYVSEFHPDHTREASASRKPDEQCRQRSALEALYIDPCAGLER